MPVGSGNDAVTHRALTRRCLSYQTTDDTLGSWEHGWNPTLMRGTAPSKESSRTVREQRTPPVAQLVTEHQKVLQQLLGCVHRDDTESEVKVKVAQPCLTLFHPMDCSPWNCPGQNTGVGAFPFSRGSSQPRDQTQVSRTAGGFFTS